MEYKPKLTYCADNGELTTDEGHRIHYSDHDTYHRDGTALMVHKDTASAVIFFKPISSRLMSLRLTAKPFKVTTMEAYARTNE